jgi:hypothetical protein
LCLSVWLALACDARTLRAENEMFYPGKTVGSIKQVIHNFKSYMKIPQMSFPPSLSVVTDVTRGYVFK